MLGLLVGLFGFNFGKSSSESNKNPVYAERSISTMRPVVPRVR